MSVVLFVRLKRWVADEVTDFGPTAVERLHNNDVKYRFTLVNYDKQFQ